MTLSPAQVFHDIHLGPGVGVEATPGYCTDEHFPQFNRDLPDKVLRWVCAIIDVHGALVPDVAIPTVPIAALSIIRGQNCEGRAVTLPSKLCIAIYF